MIYIVLGYDFSDYLNWFPLIYQNVDLLQFSFLDFIKVVYTIS